MGRPSIQVQNLHGYTIEELIDLKNTAESHYTRLALTAITMRYLKYSNEQIIKATGLSKVSIVAHIKNWNDFGLKSIEDHRGGNRESKLTPDIIDDLVDVVLHKTPQDFEFIGYTWTLELLSLYIKQNYGIDISGVTIRTILKSNKLSHKRAQPKPTKADKGEQEAFKKNFRNTEFFRVFI
jgi:transposase